MGQQHKNLDEDKATNHRKKRILLVDDDAVVEEWVVWAVWAAATVVEWIWSRLSTLRYLIIRLIRNIP